MKAIKAHAFSPHDFSLNKIKQGTFGSTMLASVLKSAKESFFILNGAPVYDECPVKEPHDKRTCTHSSCTSNLFFKFDPFCETKFRGIPRISSATGLTA
jgi:hypothetical protein